jgi:hypothetical protein
MKIRTGARVGATIIGGLWKMKNDWGGKWFNFQLRNSVWFQTRSLFQVDSECALINAAAK